MVCALLLALPLLTTITHGKTHHPKNADRNVKIISGSVPTGIVIVGGATILSQKKNVSKKNTLINDTPNPSSRHSFLSNRNSKPNDTWIQFNNVIEDMRVD